MNPMLKRIFEIQQNDTLRKAVYVADEMRDYFHLCFVCQLEESGFSFRFMRHPEKIVDIDIYPEDEAVVLLERDGSTWTKNLLVENAVAQAKEIIEKWKQ